MNFDKYKCPNCGEYLVDHLGMCGLCPSCGGIYSEEEVTEINSK